MTIKLPEVGASFTATHTFTLDEIGTFARLVGDQNPLHHDPEIAAASRFGEVIASGAHTVSVMMGRAAAWTSREWPSVGLGYTVRLRRAVPAGMTCTITWRIVSLAHNARMRGTIVDIEGALLHPDGQTAVSATTQALIFDDVLPPAPRPE